MTNDTWLLENVVLVPMDGPPEAPLGNVRRGALRIRGDRIVALGDLAARPGERTVDGRGDVALPGFVQGHVHCTQTLFRGIASDLALLPWLQRRIWPLENAHDAASTRASARLTFAELLFGGTTTVQTMESVRNTEVTCEEALASGLTVITGNCLMDTHEDGVPPGLPTSAADNLARTEALWRAFHGRNQRLHVAVSPRFVLSCTEELGRSAAALAKQLSLRVHTHAGEHPDEVKVVRERFGRDYVEVLHDQGLLGERTSLAHCVHTTPRERDLLRTTRTAVLHCPSTNLKLGSGIAPIPEYRRLGLRVAIGADGAPCNDRLSMPTELRQAALLQCHAAGPGVFRAEHALWIATRGGAEALGLADEVGSLRPGLRADVVLFAFDEAQLPAATGAPIPDVATTIVYVADERCIRAVLCGGEFVKADHTLLRFDRREVRARADEALPKVLQRAGLAR